MHTFSSLYDRAVARKGADALEARLVDPLSYEELAAIPDDRWLARLTQGVFSAGFVWSVIENKWPGFEEAFDGFDPPTVAAYEAEKVGELLADTRIVRNGQKIFAAIDNARFVAATSAEHGGFGHWIGDWPDHDLIGLYDALKQEGSRLGGATAQYALRAMGKDSYILTNDVTASLIEQGIVAKAPTSKRDKQAVQEAFNAWREESGRPFNHISVVLACGVDS